MALNIREGDILTLGGKDYPILFCGVWKSRRGSSPAQKRMCSETASTKRNPTISGSKRGDAVTQIASMKCQPLDPVGVNTREMIVRRVPNAPTDLLETIVDGGDTFYQVVVERMRQ